MDGLLFFPITPFQGDGSLALEVLRQHVETGIQSNPGGVFVACGAGEFHSLSNLEIEAIVSISRDIVDESMPLFSGIGGQIGSVRELAGRAGSLGIDGFLVFPPFASTSSEDGLIQYFAELNDYCDVPLIAYNRPGTLLTPRIVEKLCELENFVAIKDGMGDIKKIEGFQNQVVAWRENTKNPRDIKFMNGTPTAELTAIQFQNIGIETYSSAVLSFAPEIATTFYSALISNSHGVVDQLLMEFYQPLARIRDEIEGGAISIVKAGARITGLNCGGVRAPLLDMNSYQIIKLRTLINHGFDLVRSVN